PGRAGASRYPVRDGDGLLPAVERVGQAVLHIGRGCDQARFRGSVPSAGSEHLRQCCSHRASIVKLGKGAPSDWRNKVPSKKVKREKMPIAKEQIGPDRVVRVKDR